MDTLRFSHMWCAGGVDGYRQRQIAIAEPLIAVGDTAVFDH
jgi:hypothetical protein